MSELLSTPLHARHVQLGAKMVPFAGWSMPVYYVGIQEEHRAVRARAGLFDVSHMGQVEVRGDGARAFLQGVLSNDLDRLKTRQAQYTLLTDDAGAIVDDLIAYRLADDRFLLVVNASNIATDVAWLAERAPAGVELDDRSAVHGMLALQGPAAMDVLGSVWDRANPPLEGLQPFEVMEAVIAGVPCLVCSTGYTGERGVELVTPAEATGEVWDALLTQREHGIVPCGLGARDTLRLEVCYPLHGNDISRETNAIEAGLGWVCALDKQFTGADVLRRVRAGGPERRLVAFRMVDRAIPRSGCPILAGGETIGVVTSGTHSPSLDIGIGMGYVRADLAEPGTVVTIDIRGRLRDAEIAPKPLYRKES